MLGRAVVRVAVPVTAGQDLGDGGEEVGLVQEGMVAGPELEREAGDGGLLQRRAQRQQPHQVRDGLQQRVEGGLEHSLRPAHHGQVRHGVLETFLVFFLRQPQIILIL